MEIPSETHPAAGHRIRELGFGLVALALGLLCVAELAALATVFGASEAVQQLRQLRAWDWVVDTPIPWCSLAGSYLLWVHSGGPRWRRLAGVLVLMNTVDAVMWTISRGEGLGLGTKDVADRYAWLFFLTGVCLGYVELLLTATLAVDTVRELNAGRETLGLGGVRTLGLVGLIAWSMLALTQTDWSRWPPAAWFGPDFPLLWVITTALVSLLCFLVTALCLTASRQLRHARRVAEASESGIDLLQSRSETEGDEIRWRD